MEVKILDIPLNGLGKKAMQDIAKAIGMPLPQYKPVPAITVPPVIEGTHARAWMVDLTAAVSWSEAQRFIVIWVIESPDAHPAWHSYAVSVIHARPIDGRPDFHLFLPDATHEIWVTPLNPEYDRNKLLMDPTEAGRQFLRPPNYVSQFIEITDALALERVRTSIEEICAGKLSPDSDHARCCWGARYGTNMFKNENA